MKQILAIIWMNLRAVPQRAGSSLVIVIGIAGKVIRTTFAFFVLLVLGSLLALADYMRVVRIFAPPQDGSTLDERIANPTGLTMGFGAFDGDALVGTVALEFSAKPKTRHKALLVAMFLHEDHRGTGADGLLCRRHGIGGHRRPGEQFAQAGESVPAKADRGAEHRDSTACGRIGVRLVGRRRARELPVKGVDGVVEVEAVEALHHQDPGRDQVRVGSWDYVATLAEGRVRAGHVDHVLGFEAEVELLDDRLGEQLDESGRVGQRGNGDAPERLGDQAADTVCIHLRRQDPERLLQAQQGQAAESQHHQAQDKAAFLGKPGGSGRW